MLVPCNGSPTPKRVYPYSHDAVAGLPRYRFSQYTLFRCCQGEPRRFEGSVLKIQTACEPSDLYWENLDFAFWKRACRVCVVVLLTLIFLIVCAASLVYFQSLSKSTLASLNENVAWVVKAGNGTECLNFCDLEMFADRLCSANGDTSKTWPTVKVFDQFTDYDGGYTWSTSCSNTWASGCTNQSRLSQVQACGGDASSMNWVGYHFSSTEQVQCWKATLSAQVQEVQVFGCPVAPPPVADRACWKVEDNCAPFYPNTLTPVSGTWTARDNQIAADMSCSLAIDVEVAQDRWSSFAKGSTERVSNPIINCFCQQQVLNVGPEFLFPPYDTQDTRVAGACLTCSP